jgi:hypothetical protein
MAATTSSVGAELRALGNIESRGECSNWGVAKMTDSGRFGLLASLALAFAVRSGVRAIPGLNGDPSTEAVCGGCET